MLVQCAKHRIFPFNLVCGLGEELPCRLLAQHKPGGTALCAKNRTRLRRLDWHSRCICQEVCGVRLCGFNSALLPSDHPHHTDLSKLYNTSALSAGYNFRKPTRTHLELLDGHRRRHRGDVRLEVGVELVRVDARAHLAVLAANLLLVGGHG